MPARTMRKRATTSPIGMAMTIEIAKPMRARDTLTRKASWTVPARHCATNSSHTMPGEGMT